MRNDPTRLAELRRHLILDSSPERAFEDITQLLAGSLDVPIVMVNLLDDGRDWFKSFVGLPDHESLAATSFCEAFFKTADDLIIAQDTVLDERFSTHPMVVKAPYIRFYAAARLAINGHTLGTLCAYDLKPRKMSEQQLMSMQAPAAAVVELLRQRPLAEPVRS